MPTKKFVKGQPRPKNAGRKKGTPNKFTTLKQAYLNAFQSQKIGGEEGMVNVFSKNDIRKMEFFKLMSKMLPSNVTVDGKMKVTHVISEKFMPKLDKKKSE